MDVPTTAYVLHNGLRLLIIHSPGQLVQLHWKILVGSDHEVEAEEVEVIHFIEHLVSFFTSTRYPQAKDNLKLLSQNGVDMHATTSTKETNVWLRGLQQNVDVMLHLLLHTITDFQLDPSVFEQERQSVLEELKGSLNDPWTTLYDTENALLFPDHPRSHSYKVRVTNTKQITKETLLEAHHKHYVPHKMTVIVAGQQTQHIVHKIHAWFAYKSVVASPRIPRTIRFMPPALNKTPLWIQINGVEQTRIRMVFRLPFHEFTKPQNKRIMDAVVHTLSESLASRLDLKLRQILGLIYSSKTTLDLDAQDPVLSTLQIETSTDPANTQKVLNAMLEILTDLQQHGFTRHEWYAVYGSRLQMVMIEKRLDKRPQRYIDDYAHYFAWRNRVETNRERQEQFESIDLKHANTCLNKWLDTRHVLILVAGVKNTLSLQAY